MSVVEVVEQPLLRVPLEALKRAAKDRKSYVEDAIEAVSELTTSAQPDKSKEQQVESLAKFVSGLQGLKRKLADVSKSEQQDAHRCKARLEHLQKVGTPARNNAVAWNKKRMDRILVDHLLRCGYHITAAQLAADSSMSDLVDLHIFLGAKKVVEALKRQDCKEALDWCAENRAKLKKIKSKLEFKLRVQEFIELVRRDRRLEAIFYAREHLAPWSGLYMLELQRALATLAFTSKTQCALYKVLFEEQQWQNLVDLFYKDLYRLNCLTPESLLHIHLQAGLAALKTPNSYLPGCSKEDPLHLPTFQKLAAGLPFAKHVHSKLICAVTKELMTDANPPRVLPNGYVYSQQAVELIAKKNGGQMVCPRTGKVFAVDELRPAFIV